MKKRFILVLIFALTVLIGCDQSNTQDSSSNLISISFLNVDGTTESVLYIEEGHLFDEPSIPVKEGYSFLGWYYDLDLTDEVTYPITLTNDTSIYLSFSANQYTVVFDSTDLLVSYPDLFVNFGENLPTLDIPTKEDYIFDGFYTMENGEGIQVYNSEMVPVISWDIPNNQTLYPSWIEIKYTSTSDLSYQDQNIGTVELTYGEKFIIPIPEELNIEGEQFAYWYIIEDGNEVVISYYNGFCIDKWQYKDSQIIYAKMYKTISSIEELLAMSLDEEYILTNDIVVTERFESFIDENVDTGFTGVLDGQGYKISFDHMKNGLFKRNYGTIKNLSIEASMYTYGGYSYYGDGAFAVLNYGTISDVNYKTKIYYSANGIYSGGISSYNFGTIKNANTYISFDSGYENPIGLGGISYENHGIIDQCYSSIYLKTSSLYPNLNIGGIVEYQAEDGVVKNSYANLNIDVTTIRGYQSTGYVNIGGCITKNYGSVYDSYSTGSIEFDARLIPSTNYQMNFNVTEIKVKLGGFIALNYSSEETEVRRCYSTIDFNDIDVYAEAKAYASNTRVIAQVVIGGFATSGEENIYDSFATGDIFGSARSIVEYSNGNQQGTSTLIISPFIPTNDETTNNCYSLESQSITVNSNSDVGSIYTWSETTLENLQSNEWILNNLFNQDEGIWIFIPNEYPTYDFGENSVFD